MLHHYTFASIPAFADVPTMLAVLLFLSFLLLLAFAFAVVGSHATVVINAVFLCWRHCYNKKNKNMLAPLLLIHEKT
jgi:hypothetical protein